MIKHYTSARGALVIVLAFLFANLSTQAQTNFGAFADNNFHNPTNWTNGLPGPGNPANIGGGLTAEISSTLTVNFALTSFGTINCSAALNVVEGGVLNNFSGSTFNLIASGQLVNNGNIDQRGTLNIGVSASFTQGGGGVYSSTGSAIINNAGWLTVNGQLNNLGTINNLSQFAISGAANLMSNGTIQNDGQLNHSAGNLTITIGASLINGSGATYSLTAGALLNNQGVYTNLGMHINGGQLTSNGTVTSDGEFKNEINGSLENLFQFNNNGIFTNTGAAVVLNEFDFNNTGTVTNNASFDNKAAFNNLEGGTCLNKAGAEINNQFGASINTGGIFSNEGNIQSVGDINNSGTFVNTGEVYTDTGGSIVNSGNFSNDNLLSNLEEISNTGVFINNGQLQNDSGGVFTNDGELYNYQPARISNQFDLNNNNNLFNYGTIENGVRVFNYGFFENNGYLVNIGDFLNAVTGTFENTANTTGAGSNGGVLENANGGVFTNDGVLNNYDEIFNLACSSFINNGIINNYYWWTNYGLFFNYGTFNELPYHQMNMDGGVEITGPSSSEICEDVTISLGADGTVKIVGTAISTTAYDNCTTLTLKLNGEDEIDLDCNDLGPNVYTLVISDRNNNTVGCSSTVTIVDDLAPEFDSCPNDIIVIATSNTAPADWNAPNATDNCGPVNVSSTHDPGELFPIGMTDVTYTATDGAGNDAVPCTFKVTVVPPGECADVLSVRQVTSTHDNCGNWCEDYVLTFGSGNCYTAGDDLLFVEYNDGSALLTGSVYQNGNRGFVDVCFTGRTGTPPTGSPKLELCVEQGGNDWTFYTSFSGKVTKANGDRVHINRFGPAYQQGIGGNLQEPDELGGSGWFTIDGSHHAGDFNFRLSAPRACQSSIYLEAECAEVGSNWTIVDDGNASGGKALLPPNNNSYDYPPLNTADLVTFNVDVAQAGLYRIFARASTPHGGSDSYWVRVNGGSWVKWNKINNHNYSTQYQWDLTGEWRGEANAVPLTFQLGAGANTIQFSWREAWACLDKIFITSIAKQPTGAGGQAENCGGTTPPPNNGCEQVTITVTPDNYGDETTWKLKDEHGNVVASGGPYLNWDYTPQSTTVCLDGCYTFKIYDAYGDGICCAYGDGSYEIVNSNGDVLASGGQFQHSESKTICTDGATPPSSDCNRNALFVVGDASLNSSDAAVKSRLESLGYTVTVQDDDYCQTEDANNKGLILISSTVHSGKVGQKYRNVTVPVINWEGWLMDDLKMTGHTAHYDYGTASSVHSMTISDGNHPIAQGGAGDVAIYPHGKTVTWGLPSSGATRIGHVPGAPDCVMLFAYDTGAHMVGMDAPARRVGFYLHNTKAEYLTNMGWTLFDRTVQWASGCNLGVYAVAQSDEVLNLAASASANRHVNLVWTNNTGFKNDFFIVERSTDGRTWEAINEVNAFEEENTRTETFQDLDMEPFMGTSYYRISTLLLDGSYFRSEIQTVEITDIMDYAVFPNPASTATKVNLDQMQGEENVSILVYNWAGLPMQQHLIETVETLDFTLDVRDLKSGTYSIVVMPAGKRPVTKKLIISK